MTDMLMALAGVILGACWAFIAICLIFLFVIL